LKSADHRLDLEFFQFTLKRTGLDRICRDHNLSFAVFLESANEADQGRDVCVGENIAERRHALDRETFLDDTHHVRI
jgi:hypothetical protein